jgi:hypothetical protein
MDMNFIKKMSDIHSFVMLQEIFESWIVDGTIYEKALELKLGYASLINYPSIYLTEDGTEREIAAAKVCHDILLEYAIEKIKEDLNSDDEKKKLVGKIQLLPPEKYILTLINEYFQLHYLLVGLYAQFTDEQLANENGDDYAKVWLNIFSKRYHLQPTEQEINENFKHLTESLRIILKMRLSPQYRAQVAPEKIKSQLSTYYDKIEGNGCLTSMFVLLVSSIMIAYCI